MALEKNFDATGAEARLYAAWEQAGAFKAGANASRDETYCVMIPPPTCFSEFANQCPTTHTNATLQSPRVL